MDLPSHFCFPLMQFIGELIILKTNDSVIPRKGGGGVPNNSDGGDCCTF